MEHGTSSGYNKYKCRCDACKDYHAEKRKRYIQKLKHLFITNPKSFKHGEHKTYVAGCRCMSCLEASKLVTAKSRKNVHPRNMPKDKHGTIGGYKYWKCRCPSCSTAWNQYINNYKATRNQNN